MTRRPTNSSIVFLCALCCVAGWLGACGGERTDEAKKPPIDVKEPIVVPEVDDPVEVRRDQGLSGLLPDGFPEDLPLFLPASLVDLGQSGGRSWVEFLTAAQLATVENSLLDAARGAGWQVTAGAAGHDLAKGDRRLRLVVSKSGSGTLYRVTY